jgi:hypothetical protein
MGTRARYDQEFSGQDGNLKGLRAAEASKGLLYASGKYWKANPNAGGEGQKDFVEISKDEWKSIKAGDSHAQDFLAEKVDQTKSTMGIGGSADILTNNDNTYETSAASKPIQPIQDKEGLNNSGTGKMQQAPEGYNLTDAPAFNDKDKTGRYNLFR